MHVVWKRPDGFHGAEPQDFQSVDFGGRARIWLHRQDIKNYPFRIAGGWQEDQATQKLNHLINLVNKDDSGWLAGLVQLYNDSMSDEPAKFFADLHTWLADLRNHLKGDTWEIDIMSQVIAETIDRLNGSKDGFLSKAKNG